MRDAGSRGTVARVEEYERVMQARAFAERAHEGQTYRGFGNRADEPYILHPLRVARAVPLRYRVVATLHDCLEDAGQLPRWLTDEERAALALLTRDKERESYADYIGRIEDDRTPAGEIARVVKVADLQDNLAHDPPEPLRSRYVAALAVLSDRVTPKSDPSPSPPETP